MQVRSPSTTLRQPFGAWTGFGLLGRDTVAGRARYLALVSSPWILATLLRIPFCPTALVLRTPCPGCGLTRATWAMLGGDFAAAMAIHPLAPLVSPMFVGLFAYLGGRYVATGRTEMSSWMVAGVAALSALLLLLWAARMLGAFGGPVPV
jgi:hypothetical protein